MHSQRSGDEGEEYIEGRNPVLEAMRSSRRVTRIYLSSGLRHSETVDEIKKLASAQGVPVESVGADEISAMSTTTSPQGVLASALPYRYYGLKDIPSLLKSGKPGLVVALDGIEDPRNLGSILRLADATGVNFVIIEKKRSCNVTPSVLKASAGAAEHVKVVRVPNLSAALNILKDEGLWVLGADPGGEGLYFELDMKMPLVVVLGGEGKGIGRLVKERCDFLARLPQYGEVESGNVSNTAAVLLYEAVRQRTAEGGATDA